MINARQRKKSHLQHQFNNIYAGLYGVPKMIFISERKRNIFPYVRYSLGAQFNGYRILHFWMFDYTY